MGAVKVGDARGLAMERSTTDRSVRFSNERTGCDAPAEVSAPRRGSRRGTEAVRSGLGLEEAGGYRRVVLVLVMIALSI